MRPIQNPHLRRMLRWLLPLVIIPAAVWMGAAVFDQKKYLLISAGVALLAVVLFMTGFERRVTGSRRMVIVAVMTALCIVGRFIPFFKPVTALTVIAAVYLGGESGFLVGALAALLSNFYFGQGPWTPFQMLAWGMIGWIAGLLQRPLKRHRALLLAYGVISGVAYSLMMDVWTVLWYDSGLHWQLYRAALVAAVPHTVLYGASNLAFLWFLAPPIGQKLERIRIKYGI